MSTAAVLTKRRPGRPKKSETTSTVDNPTDAAAPVKRGPGRPRKNPLPTDAAKPRQSKKSGEGRQVLSNPFKAGENIQIPAGVTFTSTAPTAKGRQVVKRGHKVTVQSVIPPRVQPRKSEKGANFLVRPSRIRAKGSGGYWKDITLTEEIVRLNGKSLSYETIDASALSADASA